MPKVPYQPYPTVTPSERGAPSISVNTPGAAFGENIGAALQHLGEVGQQASSELFTRALAIQELKNQAEHDQLASQYDIQAGQLHANFTSLKGKAAVDAQGKYNQDLQDLRTQIGDQASNPRVRKMYDSTSLSMMGRTIFNGAGHAGQEMKNWQISSAQAVMRSNENYGLTHPDDNAWWAHAEDNLKPYIASVASANGWDDAQTKQYTDEMISSLNAKRIEGWARTKPFEARKKLDEAIADQKIRGDDIGKMTDRVNREVLTSGAKNIALDVKTGMNISYGDKVVDMGSASKAISGVESGGNYDAKVDSKTKHGNALGKYQVMEDNLPTWLQQAGLPSMTPDEFLANHEAQERVFTKVFGDLMKQYGNFNDAASVWFTGRSVNEAVGAGAHDININVQEYLRRTNKILASNAPIDERISRAEQMSESLVKDPELQPLVKEAATQQVVTEYNREKNIQRDRDYENSSTIEQGLINGKGQIKDIDGLRLSDPRMAAAVDSLSPPKLADLQGRIRRYNAAVNAQSNQDTLFRLRGMAESDPDGFLAVDPTKEQLSSTGMSEIWRLQQQKRKSSEASPQVQRALGVLKPLLDDGDIGVSKKDDPDRYNLFVGLLQDEMVTYQQEHKKAMPYEEIQKLGKRLLGRTLTETHGVIPYLDAWIQGKAGGVPFIDQSLPREEADRVRELMMRIQPGIYPSDQEVNRQYLREQYLKLYGKKSTPSTPSP